MHKSKLMFPVFFALYTGLAVFLLLIGLGPALASWSTTVQDAFESWGQGGGALASLWRGMADASSFSEGTRRVVLDYLFSTLNIGLGVLLVLRRPKEHAVRLLGLALVGTGVVFNFQAHGVLLTTGRYWSGLHLALHAVSGATYVHALLAFPNGGLVGSWSRFLVALTYLGMLVVIFAIAIPSSFGAIQGEEASDKFLDFVKTAESVMFVALFGLLIPVIGVTSQLHRYRAVSTAQERQQTKLFVWALAVAFVAGLLFLLLTVALNASEWHGLTEGFEELEELVFLNFPLLFSIVPIAIVLAVMRERLWDIDLLINRTLLYIGLTGALVGTYFGIVVGLQAAFRAATGQESAVAVVASTLAIAALFLPLRRRLQDFINRRFYRRRYDAARTLASFAATARDEVDLERLSSALVAVVRDTMRPAHVSLWLRETAASSIRRA